MSSDGPSKAKIERLFPFQIQERSPRPSSWRDSYTFDLLGFVGGVPMLVAEIGSPSVSQSSAPAPLVPLLQGQRVIVKTNSTSGEKSLIFKQKTGQSLEIPARRCSFVKPDVGGDKALPVPDLAPISRHQPAILRRKSRQLLSIASDKRTDFAGASFLPIDHNYSVPVPDLIIDLSSETDAAVPPKRDEILVHEAFVVGHNEVPPLRQPPPLRLPEPKSIKMETEEQPRKRVYKICQIRSYPGANKVIKKINRSVQTVATAPKTRTVETNTDDSLLQDVINSRIQEKAVQKPVPVSVDFGVPEASSSERAASSPFSLLGDNDLIQDLRSFFDDSNMINGPIIGGNANFGTGPVFSGKYIDSIGKSVGNYESSTQLMDISYSRGKNIYNGGWTNTSVGQSRIEPWKVQFFLDLKHCNQFDSYGNMPLHVAVMENNIKLVRRQCFALRIRSIHIDTLNHNSLTALQLAVLHDANIAILQTLINHKANTSILDAEGNTLLHLAVMHSSDAAVQMLLGTCSSLPVDASNFEGDTALIMCVVHEKYVKADKILQAGADPNIGDKKSGRTPLFHAVEMNNVELVKILLNYKAQTKVRNFFGTSPHDAVFELDSIDRTIRKLVLNKDFLPYKQRANSRNYNKRRKGVQEQSSGVTVKVRRTLQRIVQKKS